MEQNKSSDKIINKEYEFVKLNDDIKKNLLDLGDYIKFKNESKITYVVLCGIKFNKDILNNININKKINIYVNQIEKNFIDEYSKKYNLIFYE